MRRSWTLALLLGVQLPAAACVSRTTPLPPPEVGLVTAPNSDGRVTVSGSALEGASIGIYNGRTLEGVIVTTRGTNCNSACGFEASLAAEGGDELRVWQFFETDGLKEVLVPNP